jgi:ketosteroid isomerase-like protein
MKEVNIEKIIHQFINAANKFDVKAALALFTTDAVIDDVSVGEKFSKIAGVRKYLEQFFVGYNTVSKLESVEILSNRHAIAYVDFTGDFGHETGSLKVTINATGLIIAIDASLN